MSVVERVRLLDDESCAFKKRKASVMHECQYRRICQWRREEKQVSSEEKRGTSQW